MRYCLLFTFLFLYNFLVAQVSPDCSTAVTICDNTPVNSGTNGYGVDDFDDADTSGCLEKTLSGAIESNSAWYRFRTSASGQLGFNISVDESEDWDFALYASDNCDNLGEPVRCNFLDNDDENKFLGVGEDPTGNTENINYEDWLEVEPGEDYYLLINNFSNVNSGFSIQFSGNIFVANPYDALDCFINNTLLGPPIAACESDFVELDATTSDAISYDWFKDIGSGYEQIIGENNATLEVTESALYRAMVRTTTEDIVGEVQVYFTLNPIANDVVDSTYCYDDEFIDLTSFDAEVLGSQSSDDFVVSYYATFNDAVNGENALDVNHFKTSGTETVYVRLSSFENPKCYDVSQDFNLIISEEIEEDFPLVVYQCEGESNVVVGDDTPDTSYSYMWDSGEDTATINVPSSGVYELTITNAIGAIICSETFEIEVIVSLSPEISNVIIDDLQEENSVTIETTTNGDYEYKLDNGAYQSSPIFKDVLAGEHIVYVNDLNGCGEVSESIVVIGFLKFFTPNSDGINDSWSIAGWDELTDASVLIFDRYGKLIKQLSTTDPDWEGFYNGIQMPASDYWFKLTYVNNDGARTEAKYLNSHFSLKR
ncbi:T9SS type B sorting domain-containing protein [Cellulophaga baltica]|uniref:T9SS type B sorting domain-containing protein n=1 Tax=Cellulophaga TaxID=104264 RepID=UPI001C068B4E|nr:MULTISPECIES: T9SS type B sorting domain-containing protein [Cellulophaga]MBU2996961.1 T9SS type B sorting domain-containing protein [Cellulophaga baltica]MDO6768359.1 T9SS type B sorting domain-containing protein [Cellulophaga sp. 1_MG-2023]